MIKINLSPKHKENAITKLGGLNLSLINLPLLALFFVSIYIVEPIIDLVYEDDIKLAEQVFTEKNNLYKKQQQELNDKQAIRKQVEELNAQEAQLTQKIDIVKQIVEKRQNPFIVLKYIADNTPSDVWITELEIDDRNLKMLGYSKSWKSIGDFIENLKSSIFFNGNINFQKPVGLQNEINKNRVETFEITTSIVSFK